jgi:hypothetical protein
MAYGEMFIYAKSFPPQLSRNHKPDATWSLIHTAAVSPHYVSLITGTYFDSTHISSRRKRTASLTDAYGTLKQRVVVITIITSQHRPISEQSGITHFYFV